MSIYKEILETASKIDPDDILNSETAAKFQDLTPKQQKQYLKDHPHSKHHSGVTSKAPAKKAAAPKSSSKGPDLEGLSKKIASTHLDGHKGFHFNNVRSAISELHAKGKTPTHESIAAHLKKTKYLGVKNTGELVGKGSGTTKAITNLALQEHQHRDALHDHHTAKIQAKHDAIGKRLAPLHEKVKNGIPLDEKEEERYHKGNYDQSNLRRQIAKRSKK